MSRSILLSLCVLLAVVAAFIVEAAPQREKRQLDGSLGGLLGGGGYGQQYGGYDGYNQAYGGFGGGYGGYGGGRSHERY
ncbi:neuropeptide-like protein 31 [Daphnia pulicaria]|uniref:neuropeptide-like protein 31 n=1 Tax=Daphnia pulicaria TaxID=35523 RepID=UPI001EEC91CB|nr:neuropeptide-like protein 31 [Daphnia pulicaria]